MALVAFVVNRTLLRDPQRFLQRCRVAAEDRGWDPWFGPASGAQDSLGLTRRAVAAGARLVFAAGGDGTVRACAEALAGTGVPLAIVPLGTANLIARALGVPAWEGRALEAGFGGRDRPIDLGRADGPGAGGTWFAAMAGIGLDAAVVAAAVSGSSGGSAGWRTRWPGCGGCAAAARLHHPRGRGRTAAAAGPVRGGGQRRAAAGRVHPAARGPARRRAARRGHPGAVRRLGLAAAGRAGAGPGLAPGPRAGEPQGGASRSARIPCCRGRPTGRSSRPAGRSASRCAREPWSFGCRNMG